MFLCSINNALVTPVIISSGLSSEIFVPKYSSSIFGSTSRGRSKPIFSDVLPSAQPISVFVMPRNFPHQLKTNTARKRKYTKLAAILRHSLKYILTDEACLAHTGCILQDALGYNFMNGRLLPFGAANTYIRLPEKRAAGFPFLRAEYRTISYIALRRSYCSYLNKHISVSYACPFLLIR